jgi:hypothetical protein
MKDSNVPQPRRSSNAGLSAIIIGLILFVGGLGLVAMIRYGSVLGLSRPDGNISIALVLGGFTAAWFGIRLMVRGRQLRTLDADEAMARSAKGPFLYLRSFELDETDADNSFPVGAGLSVPINPWEGSVAQGLVDAGPMVAIGRPGETFATTGASRVYVSDDEWQDKVIELAEKAEMVFWVYGETEGLRWEIGKLTAMLPPEKLVLALPVWQAPLKERAKYWDNLVAQIGHSFPNGLPDEIGDALFIAFDSQWQAQPVHPSAPPLILRIGLLGGWNRIVWGIRTLLDSRGIARYQPGRGAVALSLFGGLLWLTVFSVMAVMAYGLYVQFTK